MELPWPPLTDHFKMNKKKSINYNIFICYIFVYNLSLALYLIHATVMFINCIP